MPLTESQKRANEKYIAANYTRIYIKYKNAYVEKVKAHADRQGESVSHYIKEALDDRMKREDATV